MDLLMIPISIVLGSAAYGLIAQWYVMPRLNARPLNEALIPLILPHIFRYIGLAFVVTGVVAADLDPAFAEPAAYGDLAAAVLALLAVMALRRGWSYAIALTWLFNIFGTLDLLNALTQGLLRIEPGQLGGAYFIPAVAVPLLLVTHFLVFRLLLARRGG